MYKIIAHKVLAPGIVQHEVEAPLIAKKRKPGNFVIVRPTPTGERIPLTIVASDQEHGTITIIVQAIGKTTHILNEMKKGDCISDVVGPLGEPTPIKNFGTVICIGGGVGTAVVYPITRALKEAGNRVLSIIGAQKQELVILEKEMKDVSDGLIVTTDDGSYGTKGFVTDALKDIMAIETPDGVFAMGPLPMMRAVAEVTREPNIKTYVSLNPIMMDGTGMCGACRVSVAGSMKFACVDGPEFDGHQINFDELISRNKTYADQERQAMRDYQKKLECKAEAAHEQ